MIVESFQSIYFLLSTLQKEPDVGDGNVELGLIICSINYEYFSYVGVQFNQNSQPRWDTERYS